MKSHLFAFQTSAMAMLAGLLGPVTLPSWAQEEPRLQGDAGLALYNTPPITRTADKSNTVLPYLYADYGNLYARVNTFGYKAMPLGNGHLELAARISFEGYRAADHGNRSTPVPVGLGTMQETAYGAFFLYGFHDTVSGGTLLDLMYAAEMRVGPVQVYPEFGLEHRSARYVQHLYGVSATEAAQSGLPSYAPGSASSPYLGLALEYPLPNNLKLSFQLTRKWLGKSMMDSPLISTSTQTSGLLALVRVFP